jgi:DNA topoisomerase II
MFLDGSHIKGLIINLFHFYWPVLLKNNFIQVMITPIIKTFARNQTFSFFSLNDFEEWKKNWKHTFQSKYYKGLGTNTTKEAKEYFSDLSNHILQFQWKSNQDDDMIDMAFSKKRVQDRKDWLTDTTIQHLDFKKKNVSFSDFMNQEFIHFSHYDNIRSIPSLLDGLKPGQRKILFSCFKRNLNQEIKVAQLSGYVSEHTGYHHGEASLHSTIVRRRIHFDSLLDQHGTR